MHATHTYECEAVSQFVKSLDTRKLGKLGKLDQKLGLAFDDFLSKPSLPCDPAGRCCVVNAIDFAA